MWEGEERYRFAHQSFLEFFLARNLVRVVERDSRHALATRPFTREVGWFCGELLRRDGRMEKHPAVAAVRAWLRTGRSEDELDASAGAAANGLRLLLQLERWSGRGGWLPEGADLRRVELSRQDLAGVRLPGARLEDAVLSGSDLRRADLCGARLDRARLVACRLDGARLEGARLRGAELTLARGRGTVFESADLGAGDFRQSAWATCRWQGVWLGA